MYYLLLSTSLGVLLTACEVPHDDLSDASVAPASGEAPRSELPPFVESTDPGRSIQSHLVCNDPCESNQQCAFGILPRCKFCSFGRCSTSEPLTPADAGIDAP